MSSVMRPVCLWHAFQKGWQGQRGLTAGLWGSELNDPDSGSLALLPSPTRGAASHRRKGQAGRRAGPGFSELRQRLVSGHSESKSWPSLFFLLPTDLLLGKMGSRVLRAPRRANPGSRPSEGLLPSLLFLLTCRGVFNSLFSAVLSKEKL